MSTLYNAQGLRIREDGAIKPAALILPPQYRTAAPPKETKAPLELKPQRWAIVGTKLEHQDDLVADAIEKAIKGGRAVDASAGWYRVPLPLHQWLDAAIGAFYRIHGLVQVETKRGKIIPFNMPVQDRVFWRLLGRPVTYTEVWLTELFGPLAWR